MKRLYTLQSAVKFIPLRFQGSNSLLSKLTWYDGFECNKTFPIIRRNFQFSNVIFKENIERRLPILICVQSPFRWIGTKFDLTMLKFAWDRNFEEEEFKRGSKQAISVISSLLAQGLWDRLRGLVTRQALITLQKDVETYWGDEHRRYMLLDPSDIKMAVPSKVRFYKELDQKFAEIDMVFFVLKFKEKEPSPVRDMVYIEIVARFRRNYTKGQIPNWTVSCFKILKFQIQIFKVKK